MPTLIKSKKFLILSAAVVVVVILASAFFLFQSQNRNKATSENSVDTAAENNSNSQDNQETSESAFAKQYSQNCQEKSSAAFTHSPLALDKTAYIEPLGKTSDGHVTPIDHVYVAPLNINAPDNTYDVVMPADGKIVEVGRMPAQYIGDRKDVTLAPDDFRVVISFSCRYYSILIHVHKLSSAVASAVGDLPDGQSKQINLDLKAGDLIANLGGSPFDWTMVDTETILKGFITPKLYEGEPWKIHTISPYDMYTGSLKKSMEAKSLRQTAPFGGKLDWDKAGALVGNWFREGTNGYSGSNQERYWDGHLSIAPHHFDPKAIIYSAGNWSGSAKQMLVKGTFKPEEVTASSGVVKIELVSIVTQNSDGSNFTGGAFKIGVKINKSEDNVLGTVLLQVQSGEKLKVEQFPGKTASQVSGFTDKAQTYER